MPTTAQDVKFLIDLVNTRRKYIGWKISKNDLTVDELDKMLEKLNCIVGRTALLEFVIDKYARLRMVPHYKHEKNIKRIDNMYNEYFQNNN